MKGGTKKDGKSLVGVSNWGGGGRRKVAIIPIHPSLSLSFLVFLALWNCENDLESPAFFEEYRAKEDKIAIAPRSDITHQPPQKRKIGESSTCFFFRTTTGADFFPPPNDKAHWGRGDFKVSGGDKERRIKRGEDRRLRGWRRKSDGPLLLCLHPPPPPVCRQAKKANISTKNIHGRKHDGDVFFGSTIFFLPPRHHHDSSTRVRSLLAQQL